MSCKDRIKKIFEGRLDEANVKVITVDASAEGLEVNPTGRVSSIHPTQCPYLQMSDTDKALLDPVDFYDGSCVPSFENVCEYFKGFRSDRGRVYCSAPGELEREQWIRSDDDEI